MSAVNVYVSNMINNNQKEIQKIIYLGSEGLKDIWLIVLWGQPKQLMAQKLLEISSKTLKFFI